MKRFQTTEKVVSFSLRSAILIVNRIIVASIMNRQGALPNPRPFWITTSLQSMADLDKTMGVPTILTSGAGAP